MQEHLQLSKDCLVSIYQLLTLNIHFNSPLMHLPMLSRRGGVYVGHLIFWKNFHQNLTLGSKKWFKSGQISLPWRQIVSNIRTSGRVFMNFTTL